MAERPAISTRCIIPGPGTDLTIGLADGHEWQGGASTAKNGITCNPNIPTEEVFTTPHARRVDGHVVSTKPLSYQGTLIDDIAVRFEEGRIVEAKATRGEEVLNKVLDTDEGARRLGEVALVPHSSPISKSGLLFFNTLFDENAACHIALGQCYSKCFVDGAKLTPEQIAAQGGNKSLIHIDWMIGSDKIDIDGVHADGRARAGVPQGRVGLILARLSWPAFAGFPAIRPSTAPSAESSLPKSITVSRRKKRRGQRAGISSGGTSYANHDKASSARWHPPPRLRCRRWSGPRARTSRG